MIEYVISFGDDWIAVKLDDFSSIEYEHFKDLILECLEEHDSICIVKKSK